ncbi:MAG: PRTRC system protein C [Candidatus Pseudobacter hemicellulosilyticus]|uniref:PRTRC system protein C n=1 Tax=Candidatus Pseudobacter hemicellulosilyticus TaxID=3121375 RepID=A0AAJ5WV35_9BACT|nr:MAG: PRTRC system protein C [Pseudobacter sp.]
MLQVSPLKRTFIITRDNREITLPDPKKQWSVETVKNFYAGQYPELTTAAVAHPKVTARAIEYRFTAVLGTKA